MLDEPGSVGFSKAEACIQFPHEGGFEISGYFYLLARSLEYLHSRAHEMRLKGDTFWQFHNCDNRTADCPLKWPRLFGQIFRLDKWIVCRG